jgi:predicted peptidase
LFAAEKFHSIERLRYQFENNNYTEFNMKNPLWSLVLGGLISLTPVGSASGSDAEVQRKTVLVDGTSYGFQVFIPAKLAGRQNLPVIVFLHGIGQRGTGGVVPTEGTSGSLVRHYLEQVPAIIVLPQCSPGKYWSDAEMDRMVMKEIDEAVDEYKADRSRIYLTGVSMGGFGVWHLASQHPGKFAALVSICGGSPLRTGDRFAPIAKQVGKTPAWIFHGSEDKTVPVSESRQMNEALKAAGGSVRYSEYEGVGHNVWMKVLGEKELVPWMLEQRLP